MSAILESLLNDERRAECCANDRAMAMGRPIIASRSAIHPEQCADDLHRDFKRVITAKPEAPRMKPVLLV